MSEPKSVFEPIRFEVAVGFGTFERVAEIHFKWAGAQGLMTPASALEIGMALTEAAYRCLDLSRFAQVLFDTAPPSLAREVLKRVCARTTLGDAPPAPPPTGPG